jgi:hypothetical protein
MKRTGTERESSITRCLIRESDRLTNIDGFMVTDGSHCRVTISKHLPTDKKNQGVNALEELANTRPEAGVYLWKSGE